MPPTPSTVHEQNDGHLAGANDQPKWPALHSGAMAAPTQQTKQASGISLPPLGMECESDDGEICESPSSDDGMLPPSPSRQHTCSLTATEFNPSMQQSAKRDPPSLNGQALKPSVMPSLTVPSLSLPSPCRGRSQSHGHSGTLESDLRASTSGDLESDLKATLLRHLEIEERATQETAHDKPRAPSSLRASADPPVLSLSTLLSPSLCQVEDNIDQVTPPPPPTLQPPPPPLPQNRKPPSQGEAPPCAHEAMQKDVPQSASPPAHGPIQKDEPQSFTTPPLLHIAGDVSTTSESAVKTVALSSPCRDHGPLFKNGPTQAAAQTSEAEQIAAGPKRASPEPCCDDDDIFRSNQSSPIADIHSPGCTPCSSPLSSPRSGSGSPAQAHASSSPAGGDFPPISLCSPMASPSPKSTHAEGIALAGLLGAQSGALQEAAGQELVPAAGPEGTSPNVNQRPDAELKDTAAFLASPDGSPSTSRPPADASTLLANQAEVVDALAKLEGPSVPDAIGIAEPSAACISEPEPVNCQQFSPATRGSDPSEACRAAAADEPASSTVEPIHHLSNELCLPEATCSPPSHTFSAKCEYEATPTCTPDHSTRHASPVQPKLESTTTQSPDASVLSGAILAPGVPSLAAKDEVADPSCATHLIQAPSEPNAEAAKSAALEAEIKEAISDMMRGISKEEAKKEISSSDGARSDASVSPCSARGLRVHRRKKRKIIVRRRVRSRVPGQTGRAERGQKRRINDECLRGDGPPDSEPADDDAAVARYAVCRGRGPPRWERGQGATRRRTTLTSELDSKSVVQHQSLAVPAPRTAPRTALDEERGSRSSSPSPSDSSSVEASPCTVAAASPPDYVQPPSKKPKTQVQECLITNLTGTRVLDSEGVDTIQETFDVGQRATIRAREVYVGNCRMTPRNKTDITAAFEALFNDLPEYRALYGASVSPVKAIRAPCQKIANVKDARYYVFVEFIDETLASTAVEMSGMQVCGISVKVNRPSDGPKIEEAARALDVTPLRKSLKLPHAGGPGEMMLLDVYVGTWLGARLDELAMELGDAISKAMLEQPCVRAAVEERFPGESRLVDFVKINEGAKYGFVHMKNEVFASTLAAMAEVRLNKNMVIRTGWPSTIPDAAKRAPPSLFKVPEALTEASGASTVSIWHDPHEICRDKVAELDVHVGGTRGIEAKAIVQALEHALAKLPAYRKTYGDEGNAVQALRTGRGPFAFARMKDAVLASTLCALGVVEVGGRLCSLGRPGIYQKPVSEGAPPLDTTPALENGEASAVLTEPPHSRPFGPSNRPRPPTPPRPPKPEERVSQEPATLWVGNINWDKTDASLLEKFLTELAIEAPIFDVEGGPPIARVSMMGNRGFAFVDLRDRKLGERLIPVFSGALYYGRPLICRWANGVPEHHKQKALDVLPECINLDQPGNGSDSADDESVDMNEI